MYKCPTCDHVFEHGSPQPLAVCEHCVDELRRYRGGFPRIPAESSVSSRTYVLIILACVSLLAGFAWKLETLQQTQTKCTRTEKISR